MLKVEMVAYISICYERPELMLIASTGAFVFSSNVNWPREMILLHRPI